MTTISSLFVGFSLPIPSLSREQSDLCEGVSYEVHSSRASHDRREAYRGCFSLLFPTFPPPRPSLNARPLLLSSQSRSEPPPPNPCFRANPSVARHGRSITRTKTDDPKRIHYREKKIIPITIPRVFYVNCLEDKGPAASTMGRRVARTLPNGRPSPFLHEVAMDEAKFQRNEKQVLRPERVRGAADRNEMGARLGARVQCSQRPPDDFTSCPVPSRSHDPPSPPWDSSVSTGMRG